MKKLLRISLLVALVVGINCGTPRSPVIRGVTVPLVEKRLYIDEAFTPGEVECIKESARNWTSATRGLARIRVITSVKKTDNFPIVTTVDDVAVHRESSSSVVVLFAEVSSPYSYLYGLYKPHVDQSEILLVGDRLVDERVCRSVVMHEIGHALGMRHSDDPGSLMYGGDSMVSTITKQDLVDFCAANRCQLDVRE